MFNLTKKYQDLLIDSQKLKAELINNGKDLLSKLKDFTLLPKDYDKLTQYDQTYIIEDSPYSEVVIKEAGVYVIEVYVVGVSNKNLLILSGTKLQQIDFSEIIFIEDIISVLIFLNNILTQQLNEKNP
jgi:hypothetical protein